MKVNKKYIKNPLFQIFLVILMTSCGGGGGVSGNVRGDTEPIKTSFSGSKNFKADLTNENSSSNINNVERIENIKNINKNDKILKISKLPENLVYDDIVVPQEDLSGQDLVVGILDSNFIQNKEKLKEKYGKIEVLENLKSTYTTHGEEVLDIFLQGITPKVIASSLGEKKDGQNIIKFSLSNYEKIMAEMEKNDTDRKKRLKVFNQSWGASLNANEEKYTFNNSSDRKYKIISSFSEVSLGDIRDIIKSGEKSLEFYEKSINEKNALFVWANGNYDANNQTILNGQLQSAAPLIRSTLEKGWISVVGIDGTNNNNDYPKHLAYSGAVSKWSIAASAEGNIKGRIGSSFAAPRVSNAAVKVGSKFDWMTNNDVRITLFTTTNKVGEGDSLDENIRYLYSTPSNRYGWGVLNIERALKGPGAFWYDLVKLDSKNWDSQEKKYYFTANIPSGITSYFENNIYGDIGLKKSGEGTLVLTGNNEYTGKSKVENGSLEIYKRHRDGIDVEENGKLVLHNNSVVGYYQYDYGDFSKEYKTLSNKGKVELKGKEAYVGNFENKGGKLYINDGSHLNVLGKANIDSIEVNIYSKEYPLPKGEEKEILVAKNIEGEVKSIGINGMRKVDIDKEDNRLVATISRENVVNYLGDAKENSIDTAKKIEATLEELDEKSISGKLSENDKKLGKTIVSMSVDEVKKTTEIVSGEIYASAQALTFIQSQNINRGISNHLSTLKDFYNSDYEWQGWASFQGSDGKLKDDGFASAKTKINGGQFGIDKRIGNSQAGVAISFSNGSANFEKYAGRYKSDSIGLSLYGKKYLDNNFYALGRIGITSFDTTVERSLLTREGKIEAGKINHDDVMLSSYIEFGKHYKYLTPFVGYSMDYLKRGEFSENGASWGVVADNKEYLKQNLNFGLQGEVNVSSYTFTGHLTHQLNIGNRDLSFQGRFTDGKNIHRFKGIEQIQNTTWLGVGVGKKLSNKFELSFNIDLRLDDYKKADTIFMTQLQYRF